MLWVDVALQTATPHPHQSTVQLELKSGRESYSSVDRRGWKAARLTLGVDHGLVSPLSYLPISQTLALTLNSRRTENISQALIAT